MDDRRCSHIKKACGQKNAGRKNRPDLEADRGRNAAKSLQSRLVTRDAGGGRLGFPIHRETRGSKAADMKPAALPCCLRAVFSDGIVGFCRSRCEVAAAILTSSRAGQSFPRVLWGDILSPIEKRSRANGCAQETLTRYAQAYVRESTKRPAMSRV